MALLEGIGGFLLNTLASYVVTKGTELGIIDLAARFSNPFKISVLKICPKTSKFDALGYSLILWWDSGSLLKQIELHNEKNSDVLVKLLVTDFKKYSGTANDEFSNEQLEDVFRKIFIEFEKILRSKDSLYAAEKTIEAEGRINVVEGKIDNAEARISSLESNLDERLSKSFETRLNNPLYTWVGRKCLNWSVPL